MQNVRIAQIGQIAVNRPVYEVIVDNLKYGMAADGKGRINFIDRQSLTLFGINRSIASTFQDVADFGFSKAFQLRKSDNSTQIDGRFPVKNLGAGPCLVSDFSYSIGWVNLAPAISQNFQV